MHEINSESKKVLAETPLIKPEQLREISDRMNKRIAEAQAKGTLDYVEYKNRGELPPLPFDFQHLMDYCIKLLSATITQTDYVLIVLPIHEPYGTKKNKVRLMKQDKTSPMGIVLKRTENSDMAFSPYAAAKFNVFEVIPWIASRVEIEESNEQS